MRTSYKWKDMPGNFDKLNAYLRIYPSSNEYGIPDLLKQTIAPEILVSMKETEKTKHIPNRAMHTFMDDYHFETLWSNPKQNLDRVKTIGQALTPDFSLYSDWPLAMQIWNTYRNRWCGCFWQSAGVQVVASVSWSTEASYPFCFLGIPKHGTIALSTVGANVSKVAKELFIAGFQEMMRQIAPEKIIAYGEASPIIMEDFAEVVWYPSYWAVHRERLNAKMQEVESVEF